jgi:RNA polymerase sigma factor (sigma-70 family)
VKRRPILATPARDDQALVASIADGNLEALGEFFERHEPAVRRYLARLGVEACDIDDLVQATFLDLAAAATRFDPQYAVRAWLFGIATMMVRRHRRSVGRRAARLVAWAGIVHHHAEPTPAEVFERDDVARRLSLALERLSDKKREVLVLVTLEGLSGEEAARTLEIPIKTVWTRLHYARVELLAALAEADR